MTLRRILATTVVAFLAMLTFGAVQQSAKHDPESVTLFGPTGNELLEYCSEIGGLKVGDVVPPTQLVSKAKQVGLCEGYIAGFNDATVAAAARSMSIKAKNVQLPYCLPSGVTLGQLVGVVRKSLEHNPARLHLPASVLVEGAFSDSFPCRR